MSTTRDKVRAALIESCGKPINTATDAIMQAIAPDIATDEMKGYPRAETIRCPTCCFKQPAKIHWEIGQPFPVYVHVCEDCGYTIMESEWEVVT